MRPTMGSAGPAPHVGGAAAAIETGAGGPAGGGGGGRGGLRAPPPRRRERGWGRRAGEHGVGEAGQGLRVGALLGRRLRLRLRLGPDLLFVVLHAPSRSPNCLRNARTARNSSTSKCPMVTSSRRAHSSRGSSSTSRSRVAAWQR